MAFQLTERNGNNKFDSIIICLFPCHLSSCRNVASDSGPSEIKAFKVVFFKNLDLKNVFIFLDFDGKPSGSACVSIWFNLITLQQVPLKLVKMIVASIYLNQILNNQSKYDDEILSTPQHFFPRKKTRKSLATMSLFLCKMF